MEHAVLILARRAAGTPIEAFREETLRRAQSAPCPRGCTSRSHAQAHTRAYRGTEPAFDAIDEYRFSNATLARDWLEQATAAAADGAESTALMTGVVPVTRGCAPAAALKHLELLHRRADMAPEAFLAYWREVHGPLAASIPGVLTYDQYPVERETGTSAPSRFDGVAMLRFSSMESLRDGARDPAFARTREDMAQFVDAQTSISLLTQEVWVAPSA